MTARPGESMNPRSEAFAIVPSWWVFPHTWLCIFIASLIALAAVTLLFENSSLHRVAASLQLEVRKEKERAHEALLIASNTSEQVARSSELQKKTLLLMEGRIAELDQQVLKGTANQQFAEKALLAETTERKRLEARLQSLVQTHSQEYFARAAPAFDLKIVSDGEAKRSFYRSCITDAQRELSRMGASSIEDNSRLVVSGIVGTYRAIILCPSAHNGLVITTVGSDSTRAANISHQLIQRIAF